MKDKTLSDEEILKKAIEKAVKNGWKDFNELSSIVRQKDYPYEIGEKELLRRCFQYIGLNLYQGIIFSHDFAKAFWENEPFHKYIKAVKGGFIYEIDDAWKYHLQIMVVSENPIKYLEQFL